MVERRNLQTTCAENLQGRAGSCFVVLIVGISRAKKSAADPEHQSDEEEMDSSRLEFVQVATRQRSDEEEEEEEKKKKKAQRSASMTRTERKRTREKRRREAFSCTFNRLLKTLLEVDPTFQEEVRERRRFAWSLQTPTSSSCNNHARRKRRRRRMNHQHNNGDDDLNDEDDEDDDENNMDSLFSRVELIIKATETLQALDDKCTQLRVNLPGGHKRKFRPNNNALYILLSFFSL
eukprot:CAMPEP_0116545220 /NCGR_PEP_ID=MMETSP0397-20121206/2548_1 /TAXON_ID=216820 /ORGANISM="Cyclophora tenuis, Strain ECT3854" /LENGTH=234 /DNA_ID=CAMNT_0004069511 /DNA_START=248 /DNA_END=953 /DNA_ORIENTATION=-